MLVTRKKLAAKEINAFPVTGFNEEGVLGKTWGFRCLKNYFSLVSCSISKQTCGIIWAHLTSSALSHLKLLWKKASLTPRESSIKRTFAMSEDRILFRQKMSSIFFLVFSIFWESSQVTESKISFASLLCFHAVNYSFKQHRLWRTSTSIRNVTCWSIFANTISEAVSFNEGGLTYCFERLQ